MTFDIKLEAQEIGVTIATGAYWNLMAGHLRFDIAGTKRTIEFSLGPSFASKPGTTFRKLYEELEKADDFEQVEFSDGISVSRLRQHLHAVLDTDVEVCIRFEKHERNYPVTRIDKSDDAITFMFSAENEPTGV